MNYISTMIIRIIISIILLVGLKEKKKVFEKVKYKNKDLEEIKL